MPTYDYGCNSCELVREEIHGMMEDPKILCEKCGAVMEKRITTNVNIIFKGAGWTTKNLREKSYREKRRREVGKKMALNHTIPEVQPNYKGEVCNNWNDAKKMAKADGVNTLRYETQVQNLKKEQHRIKEKVNKLVKGEG